MPPAGGKKPGFFPRIKDTSRREQAALGDLPHHPARQAAASSLGQLGRDDREMVVKALLPVFGDPAFEKTIVIDNRPAYDHAFDILWAIAGSAASLQEE